MKTKNKQTNKNDEMETFFLKSVFDAVVKFM